MKICRVNPTDRDLPQEESDRRYRQKSALQSLLIGRFPDELEVIHEKDELVLLRHLPGGRDACHTLISELDEEAQRWVCRQLDEQESEQLLPTPKPAEEVLSVPREVRDPEPDHEAGLDEKQPPELLKLGQAALEQYDLDQARHCFELAFSRSRGSLVASLELLELLVDHLAAYQESLALEDLLSPEAARDSQVRTLLGLAAARASIMDRAIDLVRGLDGPRVAEVYLVLTENALRAGNDEDAGRYLQAAEEHGPEPHRVSQLGTDLAALRAQRWGPVEAEIAQLFERGELEEAETKARELLDIWPGARRVLREIGDRRKQDKIAEVLSCAEEAMGRQDFSSAAELYDRALRQGADKEQVQPLLDQAGHLLRREKERQQVERVTGLLAGPDRAAGLAAYLGLDTHLRGKVRSEHELPVLTWLEEAAPRSGEREDAVEAVLALEQMDELQAAERPEEVLALLQPWTALLGRVTRARELLKAAEGELSRRRQRRVQDVVQQARAALDAEDPGRALECLKGLPEEPQGEERRVLKELEARATRMEAEQQSVRQYGRLLEAGELLEARDLARRHIDSPGLDAPCPWQQRLEAVQAQIRQEWKTQTYENGLADDLIAFDLRGISGDSRDMILPDGEGLVLATVEGRWLFVRIVDVGPRKVVRGLVMKTPEALGVPVRVVSADGSVWLTGTYGWVLQLDSRTLDVVRWCRPVDILRVQDQTKMHLLLNGRYSWITTGIMEEGGLTWIVDLERWRVEKTLDNLQAVVPISCGGERLAVCATEGGGCRPFWERGSPIPGFKLRDDIVLTAATTHPDGDGLVVLHLGQQGGPGSTVKVGCTSADGSLGESLALTDASPTLQHAIASSRADGAIYALVATEEPSRELISLKPRGNALEQVYRVRVPSDTILAQERSGARVAVVSCTEDGIVISPLGDRTPEFHDDSLPALGKLPVFDAQFVTCGRIRPRSPRSGEIAEQVRALPAEEAKKKVDLLRSQDQTDREFLDDIDDALFQSGELRPGEHGLDWRHDPEFPEACVGHGHYLAMAERWHEVRDLLEGIDPDSFEDVDAQHIHHLLGIAHYLTGDIEGAWSTWLDGEEREGGACDLQPYLELADFDRREVRPERRPSDAPMSAVVQVATAIVTADLHLDRGAPSDAIGAVNIPLIWLFRELQGLARLTEAWLLMEHSGPSDRWNKALALAAFCQRHHPQPAKGNIVPYEVRVVDHTWDKQRLDDLHEKAQGWLDNQEPGLDVAV